MPASIATTLPSAGQQQVPPPALHVMLKPRDDQRAPGFEHWFSVGNPWPGHGGTHTYVENEHAVEIAGHKTQVLTDQAVAFLRRRDFARPFFLFVGYTATHSHWKNHPERLVQSYRSCSFADIPADPVYPFGRMDTTR